MNAEHQRAAIRHRVTGGVFFGHAVAGAAIVFRFGNYAAKQALANDTTRRAQTGGLERKFALTQQATKSAPGADLADYAAQRPRRPDCVGFCPPSVASGGAVVALAKSAFKGAFDQIRRRRRIRQMRRGVVFDVRLASPSVFPAFICFGERKFALIARL